MRINILIEDSEVLESMQKILKAIGFDPEIKAILQVTELNSEELYLLDRENLERIIWNKEVTMGKTVLDLSERILRCEDKSVRLSPRECGLLKLLMRSEGRCLSKQWILRRVWGMETTATENNVEAYVRLLRRKLQTVESELSIETIRWQGYRVTNLKNP